MARSRNVTGRAAFAAPFCALACALAMPARAAAPVPAEARYEVEVQFGRTFGVQLPPLPQGTTDEVKKGGYAVSIALLLPIESRMRVGLEGFAVDMGSVVGEAFVGTPPTSLGNFELLHLDYYGVGWRVEHDGPSMARFSTFALARLSYLRGEIDQSGEVRGAGSDVGFGIGGGALLPLAARQSLGLALRWDHLYNDDVSFLSASLAWRWRVGSQP
jgi:hypothetical protein